MIVKKEESYNMVCPMALPSDGSIRCGGDKCMAWRDFGDGRGFCGMCPITPLIVLRVEEVTHD